MITMSRLLYTILFLHWLQDEYLNYLDKWESRLSTLGLEKKKTGNSMMLSHQTLFGLGITGKVRYIYI